MSQFIGRQMTCTKKSMQLVSHAIGVDIIELWSEDEGKLHCTYVHCTPEMHELRPDIISGSYPEHKKEHLLSPKVRLFSSSSFPFRIMFLHDKQFRNPLLCFG
jgi:hypothetical protein